MPERTARFVSAAALVILLAGIPLATTSHGETPGDDLCLTSPKGETPAGHHWYYRLDRTSNRQCWYLRPQTGNPSQAAPQNILPSAPPASQAPPRAQPSVADARAEVRARSYQDSAAVSPALPAVPMPPAVLLSSGNAAPAVIASRWPDLSAVISAPSKPAASGNGVAPEASSLPQAAATVAPLAAAAAAVPGEPHTIMNLIAATMGLLALAGIIAVFMSTRSRPPRLGRGDLRFAQGPISEMTDDARIVLSPHPASGGRGYRFARNRAERGSDRARGSSSRTSRRTAV